MEDDDPIVQKKFVENLVQMQRTGLMTGGLQDISDWMASVFKYVFLRIKWNISGQPAKDDFVCGLSMRISFSTGWLF